MQNKSKIAISYHLMFCIDNVFTDVRSVCKRYCEWSDANELCSFKLQVREEALLLIYFAFDKLFLVAS